MYPTYCFTADRASCREPPLTRSAPAIWRYWQPYHQQLQDELTRLKAKHGYALSFDAHSIASVIPRLFHGHLPDLNLGTNGGESRAPARCWKLEATRIG
ncbi:N-formylglutamate amidohydrolase [Serratia proteamaculans]